MFRRSRSTTEATPAQPVETPGGKGRPTPSRREAEAAARARAKVPRTRKEIARAQREARLESSQKVRAAMKSGDERYFMPRDQGPMRRFVRDLVDSRFSFIELMIPLLLVSIVLGYSGVPRLQSMSTLITMGMFVLIVIDMLVLRRRLRKELAARFPGESTKGTTYYAVMRSLQMKFMRLPKAQVKIGQELPEHYR